MVNEQKLIFQTDSLVVRTAFETGNYDIEYIEEIESNESELCAVYFSSNEIYYPNTLQAFEYSIIRRDKYEWKKNKYPKAKKHIYLRDIRKQWYLGGINETLDNPWKLLEFLQAETSNYRVITIGSSAGGYAALLFGSLLKCERIYAFNAQLNLNIIMRNSNELKDPILFKLAEEDRWQKFYDLSNFISSKIENYYFQSCRSKIDLEQFDGITALARNKIKIIRFLTANHGFPFLRANLPVVLAFSTEQIRKYENRTFHPVMFSIRLIGVVETLRFVSTAFWDRYKKKRLEGRLRQSNNKCDPNNE